MNEFVLGLITMLHLLFIILVVVIPFTNSTYLLLVYVTVIPFVVFHWLVNDNTCFLTMMEKNIRQKLYGEVPNSAECFTARIIEPVYDFKKNYESMSTFIYLVTFVLWGVAVYKLVRKYCTGEIRGFKDLFRL